MVDEVIVMHNVRAKVSMLFDIRTDDKSTLAAPLPISFVPGSVLTYNSPTSNPGSGPSGDVLQTSAEERAGAGGIGEESKEIEHPPLGLDPNGRLLADWHSKRLKPRYLLHFQRNRSAGRSTLTLSYFQTSYHNVFPLKSDRYYFS